MTAWHECEMQGVHEESVPLVDAHAAAAPTASVVFRLERRLWCCARSVAVNDAGASTKGADSSSEPDMVISWISLDLLT